MNTTLSNLRVAILVLLASQPTQAANIGLTKIRDLSFSKSTQGDIAASEAATSGNANSAKYTVTGDIGKTYTVTLPSSVTMTGAGAGVITNSFTKSSANSYTLDGTGQDTLYVGATRAAIPGGQTAGAYSVNYQVSVRYTTGGKTVHSFAASTLTILITIAVTKVADLLFGEAAQEALAKVINPASDAGRAQFTVTGQPNAAYQITVPSTVTMTTGAGGTADTQIDVTTFTSSPTSPATLPPGGSQTVYVGGTRAAIRATQTAGNYTGSFQITVAYQ